MGLLATKEVLTLECSRDNCFNQSPQYKYKHSTRQEDIRTAIMETAYLARKAGWFIIDINNPICDICYKKTLEKVREIANGE